MGNYEGKLWVTAGVTKQNYWYLLTWSVYGKGK